MSYYYSPGSRFPTWKPVVIADIHLHIGLWREFKSRTGDWPIASILLFFLRFVFVGVGIGLSSYFLLRHHSAIAPKAVAGRLFFLVPISLAVGAIFAVEQASRYVTVAGFLVLSAIFFANGDSYPGRLMLICLQIASFAAIWGLVEQLEWNRQLRSSDISSSQEVWATTQFPFQEDRDSRPSHV